MLSQSGSCFILSISTCIHWTWITENTCPRFFYNCEFLTQNVRHSFSYSNLAALFRTLDRMCWILYSSYKISLLRIAKDILALAIMLGSPSITWSSRTSFWNWRALDNCWYDWSIISVSNWYSSNKSWVCYDLVIIRAFLFRN